MVNVTIFVLDRFHEGFESTRAMSPPKLKEVYEVDSIFKSFFTGGDVEWTNDGKQMLCQCGGSIQFLDVESGMVTGFIGEEEIPSEDSDVDLVLTFKLTYDNENIISAHKSGLFKLWGFKEKSLKKHWKSVHKGPVLKLAVSRDGLILATGGSDSSVRIWDLVYNSCTRNFTDVKGVCSVLEMVEFAIDEEVRRLLFAAGDDGVIKAWNLSTGAVQLSLEGHYSTVTGLTFSLDLKHIISCSRDKVLIVWDMESGKQLNVIPTYESLESVITLSNSITLPFCDMKYQGGVYVATAGDRGVVRVWDVLQVKELFVQNNSLVKKNEEGGLSITRLLYCPAVAAIAMVSHDHNIFIHSLDMFRCINQFIGYSDEILDIAFVGDEDSHIAAATNSPDIKVYTLENMSCSLLTGHTGFVVTIAVCQAQRNVFASASKDNSVRVWMLVGKTGVCIASGMYHNKSVAGLALSHASLSFLLSGGEDNVLKMWKIPKDFGPEYDGSCLAVKATCLAHEKDINSIAVSPNDKFVATASLDKTAKLWSTSDLSPLGTFRGHRRGIWSIIFSPVDQVVLTSSADTTIKIWSLGDLSCLKTLEGHESSVMKAVFLSRGLQVLSASGDGLIKLWTIKSSECIGSFDGHIGKIWALAVGHDEKRVISGCSASKLVIWRDVTEEKQLAEAEKQRIKTLKDQALSNLIEAGDYLTALQLALSLERPATVLKIVQEVIKKGDEGLAQTVIGLEMSEKESLLNCAAHWNTNSKTAFTAQFLISILLDEIATGKLKPPKSMIEVLIPYTERHYNRLTQLLQDLHILDYTTLLMKDLK